ncbi:MAG TPA: peptidoglycan bridge formation glycyltransferase FemA/FemB family protein [Alphaproteobacteria bacterium]|jgi:lipid II:glycine glycyltransferase (peptidoglycan interpeptide bridge formation enzyme)|nr:peptidoglycan bridge formation glycyltransferase FemA/FemB family protein [Alphaproteobacteria bacterium]
MAKYTTEIITDKKVWEEFILSKKPYSFLQSWAWGETNEKTGVKIFRLGFKKDNQLVGVCLLIKEDAKRGPHLIIPGGPIIDWDDKKIVSFFVEEIKKLAQEEKVWFVRVRPEIKDSAESQKFFEKLGFISAPMHLHAENTWILDISKSEEELLVGMRKSTRYLVKKSLTLGLDLEISKDPKSASILFDLQKETAKRHKFVGFSQKLFESEIESFVENDNAAVFICRKDKKVLAAAIIIFYGDTAYYHFSGSVSGFNEIPFSYFLQWEVIKEAKKREMKYYNFWGIAPNDNPKHRFAGVTLFKTGFGGERIDWLHAHDLPISLLYWITYGFESLRKVFRRL